jgi:hypothetical protein
VEGVDERGRDWPVTLTFTASLSSFRSPRLVDYTVERLHPKLFGVRSNKEINMETKTNCAKIYVEESLKLKKKRE